MVFPSGTGWCSWCFGSKCQGQMDVDASHASHFMVSWIVMDCNMLPYVASTWMMLGRYSALFLFLEEAPDILSHCAVRARNFGVLLCTCTLASLFPTGHGWYTQLGVSKDWGFDPKISEKLAADFANQWVEVRQICSGHWVICVFCVAFRWVLVSEEINILGMLLSRYR